MYTQSSRYGTLNWVHIGPKSNRSWYVPNDNIIFFSAREANEHVTRCGVVYVSVCSICILSKPKKQQKNAADVETAGVKGVMNVMNYYYYHNNAAIQSGLISHDLWTSKRYYYFLVDFSFLHRFTCRHILLVVIGRTHFSTINWHEHQRHAHVLVPLVYVKRLSLSI